jgi:hypothetical protein
MKLTVEYLIDENANISRLDRKINELIIKNNLELKKIDLLQNQNKRFKLLPKSSLFKVFDIEILKDDEKKIKKILIEIYEKLNPSFNTTLPKLLDIKKYTITSCKTNNCKKYINKYFVMNKNLIEEHQKYLNEHNSNLI